MMQTKVNVRLKRSLEEVLLTYGYLCEHQNENINLVSLKNIDVKLIIIEQEGKLYFQLDILGVEDLEDDVKLYKELLNLNYEIVPLSVAIDKTEEENQILILNTALEGENLDENELIKTIHNFEDSVEKIILLLKSYYIEGFDMKEGEISGL